MPKLSLRRPAALFAALFGLAAGPALLTSAAPAAPAVPPGPCVGIAADDPTGDASGAAVVALNSVMPQKPNLDVTEFWFRRDNNKTSVFVRVADLVATVPTGATNATWYVVFTDTAGANKFVSAKVDLTTVENPGVAEVQYGYGTLATQFTTEGATTGALFPGKNGVVRIDVPGAIATTNTTLGDPYVTSREGRGVAGNGLVTQIDRAPNAGGGVSFKVANCPPPPAA